MIHLPLPLKRFTAADLRYLLRKGPRLRDLSNGDCWSLDHDVAKSIRSRGCRWAIQDDAAYLLGSALTWLSSTGTYVITCTSLAAGTSRQGGKTTTTLVQAPSGLSTAILPDLLSVQLQFQLTAAATAGGPVELYFGFSNSTTAGTNNPGGLTGVDGAGPNNDVFPQLTFVGALAVSNNLGTAAQLVYLETRCRDIAFSPVIYNNSSQAFDATALHTILTVVPEYRVRST